MVGIYQYPVIHAQETNDEMSLSEDDETKAIEEAEKEKQNDGRMKQMKKHYRYKQKIKQGVLPVHIGMNPLLDKDIFMMQTVIYLEMELH